MSRSNICTYNKRKERLCRKIQISSHCLFFLRQRLFLVTQTFLLTFFTSHQRYLLGSFSKGTEDLSVLESCRSSQPVQPGSGLEPPTLVVTMTVREVPPREPVGLGSVTAGECFYKKRRYKKQNMQICFQDLQSLPLGDEAQVLH